MLNAWLDFHRDTLLLKCAGLTDDQLRLQSVPGSTLSLLGLVRHMTDVERGWFRCALAGEEVPPLYRTAENPEGDFAGVATADVGETFKIFDRECDLARQAVAAAPDLDAFGRADGRRAGVRRPFTGRWILVHMIEEYARHNGHADLLRERIDGATGV
jgi:uncharacterized damage-inducible protein DinB